MTTVVDQRGGALPQRPLVLVQLMRARRRSTLWWALSLVAVSVLFAAAFPSTKASAEDLDSYIESLPEGLTELLGASAGIATPAGYLNSQLFSNVFPLLLVVLGVGLGAWAVAGSESEGTLEMLLANPVRRARVAWERFGGLAAVTLLVALAGTASLAAVAPAFELTSGLPSGAIGLAGLGGWALALLFSAAAFAVGAATGSRGAAIAAGAGLAAGTYVVYGISSFVDAASWSRWVSPWHWYLDAEALGSGSTWTFWLQAVALPLGLALVLAAAGTARFTRRDVS